MSFASDESDAGKVSLIHNFFDYSAAERKPAYGFTQAY